METKDFEQTLVLIKPDALRHSLTGYVLSQLSEFHTGLRFAGSKIVNVHRMLAEEHYAEHKGKVFFESLLEYIMGASHYPDEAWKRRVIALVYVGPDAILKIRGIAGPTNPHEAREKRPGCIRALGTLFPVKDAAGKVLDERMDNLIHASANRADAEREIKLWFKPSDLPPAMRDYDAQPAMSTIIIKTENCLPTMSRAASASWHPAMWPGSPILRPCSCWPKADRHPGALKRSLQNILLMKR